MFEPIIKTDLSALPQTIETNLDDLKPFIDGKIAFARSLAITDSIEDCELAESKAAELTKMQKRVSQFRLQWTKQWQSPFESVIAKCKGYERQLGDCADELRGKANEVREKAKKSKRALLLDMWEGVLEERGACMEDAPHFRTWFDYMTDKRTPGNWLNRTKKVEDAKNEMVAEVERCENERKKFDDNAIVKGATVEERIVASDALLQRFQIADALQELSDYREQQEHLKTVKANAEAKLKAKAQAFAKSVAENIVGDDKVLTYRLELKGTREELLAVRTYLDEHGITYTKI